MIEPAYATRLGFTHTLVADDEAGLHLAVERMRGLGTRHLRLPIAAALCRDPASLSRVLAQLAPLDILLSIDLAGAADLPDWLAPLLAGLDGRVSAIELCGAAACAPHAARLVRDAGCHAVFGTASPAPPAAALTGFDAIGLHHTAPADWDAVLAAAAFCGLPVWITQTGYPAWQHDSGRQAQAFADAVAAPAARIYWQALSDPAGLARQDPAATRSGLFDAAGQPSLLARLLDGGVAELDRVLATARRMQMPAILGTRPVLVTGGAGFIGANLADRLASEGHQVLIYDALARTGVERNLHWLARRHPGRISFELGDLRDEAALSDAAAGAQAVFHLAGQVAVTTSMVLPLADFEVNARGTIALLEAVRQRNPAAPVIFASTNKVYGDLADIDLVRDGACYLPSRADLRTHGIDEQRPLCFHTPYGCSKGAADQYVLDYAHSFGLRAAVLRMSCIYGERQLGTEDQGWVAHFLLKAIAGQGLTIYGDGRQVRDVLHVGDAIAAYMAAWSQIDTIAGRAYNLGGGPANAISLLQLVGHIEDILGRRVDVAFADWRPGDQRYFVADTRAVRRDLGLPQALGWRTGVARLAEHFGAPAAVTANAAPVPADAAQ